MVGQGGRTGEGDLGGGVVRQDVIRVQVPGGETRAALITRAPRQAQGVYELCASASYGFALRDSPPYGCTLS